MPAEEAVGIHRAVLEVYTRETLPTDWATTQVNLGVALRALAERAAGDGARALNTEALTALRAALQVRTQETFPRDWVNTQNNVGNALTSLAEETEGDASRSLFMEARRSFRAALGVATRDTFPYEWAMTQHNLANSLSTLASRTPADEGRALYGEALDAYRAALQVWTRDALPQTWASTQRAMASTLRSLARRSDGDAARVAAKEAVRLSAELRAHAPAEDLFLFEVGLLQNVLFDYAGARNVMEAWLATNPPPSVVVSFYATEALVTTAEWDRALEYSIMIRDNRKMPASIRLVFGTYAVLVHLARRQSAADAVARLIAVTEEKPEGDRLNWSIGGVRHFVGTNPVFEEMRDWAESLLDAAVAWTPDVGATRLRSLQAELVALENRKVQ